MFRAPRGDDTPAAGLAATFGGGDVGVLFTEGPPKVFEEIFEKKTCAARRNAHGLTSLRLGSSDMNAAGATKEAGTRFFPRIFPNRDKKRLGKVLTEESSKPLLKLFP